MTLLSTGDLYIEHGDRETGIHPRIAFIIEHTKTTTLPDGTVYDSYRAVNMAPYGGTSPTLVDQYDIRREPEPVVNGCSPEPEPESSGYECPHLLAWLTTIQGAVTCQNCGARMIHATWQANG